MSYVVFLNVSHAPKIYYIFASRKKEKKKKGKENKWIWINRARHAEWRFKAAITTLFLNFGNVAGLKPGPYF